MPCRFLTIITLSLWSAGTLLFSGVASAEVKLTSATIRELRNQVQFQPRGERWRNASRGTTMQPLDALKTASKSWAELRFNDRSLARIGERALFQFLPDTRTFDLRNGTVLLLIPPKQGRTRVQTPNAVAGIRGSALFIRYNPETDTTLVGALTNSEIEVAQNKEGTQAITLKAGQMALLVQDRIFEVYNFDLRSFYETSEMVRDLDLPRQNPTPNSDEAIAAVQEETAEALKSQPVLANSDVVVNPPWVAYSRPAEQPVVSNPALQNGIDRSLSEGFTNLILVGPDGLAGKAPTETTQNSGAVIAQPSAPSLPSGLTGQSEGPIGTAPLSPVDPEISPRPQPAPTPDPASPVRPDPVPAPPTPVPAPNPEPISRPTPSPSTPTQPTPAPVTTQPTPTPINRPEPLPASNPTPVVTPPVSTPVQSSPPVTTPAPTTPAPIVRPDPQPISTINLPQLTRPTPTPITPSPPTVTAPTVSPSTVVTPSVTTPAATAPTVTAPVTVPTAPPAVITPLPTNSTLPANTGTTPTVTPGTAPVSPVVTPQPAAQGAPTPSPSPAAAPTPEPAPQTSTQPAPTGITTP
ncbi:FecR domain-containing protein [Leptothermofonsia sp. ETS-13]|uniref:FecR domain-containing protein n=1 Tax=Leptothermofonsia sp. ETS-13 TaxID=3035696 RepID=UPI003B9E367F